MNIHWKQVFAGLLIGFIAGGLAFGNFRTACFPKHGPHKDMKAHIMKRFDKNLHLTAEQKEKISTIFDETHPKMMALHEEMHPKFEAVRSEASQKIREVLTPDQQVKFEKMEAKWQERMKRFRPDAPKES